VLTYSAESVNCVPGKRISGTYPVPAPAGSGGTSFPLGHYFGGLLRAAAPAAPSW